MKFIRKQFTTKDANGCEFKVLALYGATEYTAAKGLTRDCDYYAFNKKYHAKTLAELKRIVSEL